MAIDRERLSSTLEAMLPFGRRPISALRSMQPQWLLMQLQAFGSVHVRHEALWLELQLTSEEDFPAFHVSFCPFHPFSGPQQEMQMWARAISNACIAEPGPLSPSATS